MAGKKLKPKNSPKKSDLTGLEPSAVLCPVCRTILIEPVTLPCNHVFCMECFDGTMKNANLVCPLCRIRVGSWFRRKKKEGKLVDSELWRAVQHQYSSEVKNKLQGIDNDIEEDKPIIIVASPGAIRKEYEKERQKNLEEQRKAREREEKASAALIEQIRLEEEYKKQLEEEKLRLDELMAKELAAKLSAPSTSKATPRRLLAKAESHKKRSPMYRFVKTDDTATVRRFSQNKSQSFNNSFPANSHSRLKYLDKEYACHVLPAQQSSAGVRLKHTTSYHVNSEAKGNFSFRAAETDRRKSICVSGYKSSGSGDNSDIIDQECKFYFKPIDTQRRYHIPGKVPVKVPCVFGSSDNTISIEPPALGKVSKLGNVISAFAKFSPSSGRDERVPSRNEIESESTTPNTKNLKRKISTENNTSNPVRKKGRRIQLTASKKNSVMESTTKSISSPFFGFNNKPKSEVNGLTFYGFEAFQIEESVSKREEVNKLVALSFAHMARCQRPTYESSETPCEVDKKSIIHIDQPSVTDIDINRNIPKPNIEEVSPESLNNIIVHLNVNCRSATLLNTALNWKSDSSKVLENINPVHSPTALQLNEKNSVTNESVGRSNNKLNINGDIENSSLTLIKSAISTENCQLNMETPPGIFDSDSDNEGLSKLIDTICNPTGVDATPMNSPVKCLVNGISDKKSPCKKRKVSPKKSPKKTQTRMLEDAKVHCTTQIVHNKLANEFRKDPCKPSNVLSSKVSKVKNSPSKSPQKSGNRNSHIETLQINGEAEDVERRKRQEEADFEFAKKLQAEFDLIHTSSRTRRGTERQITLDEMLAS